MTKTKTKAKPAKLTPQEEEALAQKKIKALEKARKVKAAKAKEQAERELELAEQRRKDAEKRLPKLAEQYDKQLKELRKIEARNTKTVTKQEEKAWDKLTSTGNQIRGIIAVIRNADHRESENASA